MYNSYENPKIYDEQPDLMDLDYYFLRYFKFFFKDSLKNERFILKYRWESFQLSFEEFINLHQNDFEWIVENFREFIDNYEELNKIWWDEFYNKTYKEFIKKWLYYTNIVDCIYLFKNDCQYWKLPKEFEIFNEEKFSDAWLIEQYKVFVYWFRMLWQ